MQQTAHFALTIFPPPPTDTNWILRDINLRSIKEALLASRIYRVSRITDNEIMLLISWQAETL